MALDGADAVPTPSSSGGTRAVTAPIVRPALTTVQAGARCRTASQRSIAPSGSGCPGFQVGLLDGRAGDQGDLGRVRGGLPQIGVGLGRRLDQDLTTGQDISRDAK